MALVNCLSTFVSTLGKLSQVLRILIIEREQIRKISPDNQEIPV